MNRHGMDESSQRSSLSTNDAQLPPSLRTGKGVGFLRACYWIGAVADLLATVPLLFPEVAKAMFGLQVAPDGSANLYASRVAASLMLGWTALLVWGSFKPVERRGVILLTLVPVLAGLLPASVLAVQSGFIDVMHMLPLWIFYAVVIPLYLTAYRVASGKE